MFTAGIDTCSDLHTSSDSPPEAGGCAAKKKKKKVRNVLTLQMIQIYLGCVLISGVKRPLMAMQSFSSRKRYLLLNIKHQWE